MLCHHHPCMIEAFEKCCVKCAESKVKHSGVTLQAKQINDVNRTNNFITPEQLFPFFLKLDANNFMSHSILHNEHL